MKGASDLRLWLTAGLLSLAIHGGLAAALALLPAPPARDASTTTIVIASPDADRAAEREVSKAAAVRSQSALPPVMAGRAKQPVQAKPEVLTATKQAGPTMTAAAEAPASAASPTPEQALRPGATAAQPTRPQPALVDTVAAAGHVVQPRRDANPAETHAVPQIVAAASPAKAEPVSSATPVAPAAAASRVVKATSNPAGTAGPATPRTAAAAPASDAGADRPIPPQAQPQIAPRRDMASKQAIAPAVAATPLQPAIPAQSAAVATTSERPSAAPMARIEAPAATLANAAGDVLPTVPADAVAPVAAEPSLSTAASTRNVSALEPTRVAPRPASASQLGSPTPRSKPAHQVAAAVEGSLPRPGNGGQSRAAPRASPAAPAARPSADVPSLETSVIKPQPQARTVVRPSGPSDPLVAAVVPEVGVQFDAPANPAEVAAKVADFVAADPTSCDLALPSIKNRRIEVSGFANTQRRLGEVGDAIQRAAAVPIELRANRVADPQCAALTFAKSLGRVDGMLPLHLPRQEIASGGLLLGRIDKLRRGVFYLIVVDDEGSIRKIPADRILLKERRVTFSAPLPRTNGHVDTVQLLLAISSDAALTTIDAMHDQAGADFFPALQAEIARKGARVTAGVAAFSVGPASEPDPGE